MRTHANESAPAEKLAIARRKKWREENRDAIRAYNEHIDKHGAFSVAAVHEGSWLDEGHHER